MNVSVLEQFAEAIKTFELYYLYEQKLIDVFTKTSVLSSSEMDKSVHWRQRHHCRVVHFQLLQSRKSLINDKK